MNTPCIEVSCKGRYPKGVYRGRSSSLHRVIYMEAHGPLPRDVYVRHLCGNKRCINLDHLMEGSHADNTEDAHRLGEFQRGEQCRSARLTENEVRLIRFVYDAGVSQQAIADQHGVSQVAVSKIVLRKTWRHI